MAFLTVERGVCAGRRVELGPSPLVIGRHTDSDVVLDDETVSRHHARIVSTANGFEIEDLESRNGTFVNGQPVVDRARLTSGDTIQLYDVVLTFSDGDHASPRLLDAESGIVPVDDTTQFRSGAPVHGKMVAEVDLGSVRGPEHQGAEIQLQAVLDVTRHMRNWLDLEDLYEQILDSLFRIFPQLDRACVLRLEDPSGRLVLDAVQVRDGDVPGTIGPIMQAIVKRAFADGKAMLNVDIVTTKSNPEGEPEGESIHATEHCCVMCAPLMDSAREPLGAIYLDSTDASRPFVAEDLDVLACVAILASQAVEQATLHNARYRAAVDTSVDGVITFNEHGTIESVNPAAVDLFAYGPGELRGMNIAALVPDLEALTLSADKSSVISLQWTFQRRGETTGRRSDGSEFPIRVSLGEFELRGRKLYTATLHDITDQKRVESTLKSLNEHLEKEVRRRTGYVKLLQDVAVIANEAESVPAAFEAVLDRVCGFTGWKLGQVCMQDENHPDRYIDSGVRVGDGVRAPAHAALIQRHQDSQTPASDTLVGRVISTGSACFPSCGQPQSEASSPPPEDAAELRPAFAFPVVLGEEVVAVAQFFSSEAHQEDETLLSVMKHVGTQLGRVVERHRLQQDVVDAVWQQQGQFGQELHDTVGQELTGVCMMASSLARRLRERGAPECDRARDLATMLQHAKQGTRRLAKGLLPVEVDADGLKVALEELAESTRQCCEIEVEVDYQPGLEVADNSIATHLFRIAQEAVTNAVKHAQARHLKLSFTQDAAGPSRLTIADDGTGIQRMRSRRRRGVGLRVMRFRAQVMGAHLSIQPGEQGGTVVTCRLPGSR